jgi:hypothetical protein
MCGCRDSFPCFGTLTPEIPAPGNLDQPRRVHVIPLLKSQVSRQRQTAVAHQAEEEVSALCVHFDSTLSLSQCATGRGGGALVFGVGAGADSE